MLAAVPLGIWRAHSLDAPSVASVGQRPMVQSATTRSGDNSARYLALRAADEYPATSPPLRVKIPRLAVSAAVLPVGLDKSRAVQIPPDIRDVGWYQLGVPPGAFRGSAVLVGHRDGREQGHGAFYDLGLLDVGDRITVTNAAGQVLAYRVVARESISKRRLPYKELFAVDGKPRLTLISCGGIYDPNNGGYQDNVVVTAVRDFASNS